MLLYSDVPFSAFEAVPWNLLLHPKPTREGDKEIGEIPWLGQHHMRAAHWGHMSVMSYMCPSAFQEMRAMRLHSLGYLFLPH